MARPDILTLASIAVLVAALYLAKGVLVPLTLAVLLSFLLSPVCDWLERRRLGRVPAVLVTAILGFTVLGAAAWTSTLQMSYLVPRIPEYEKNLEAKLDAAKMSEVKKLRADGEAQHKAGKHGDSMAALGKAKSMLGIK